MLRLLKIEWIKIRNSKSFKILGIIWIVAFLAVPLGVNSALEYFESLGLEGSELIDVSPKDFPIFDFTDIWQNLAYVYKYITILLCFVIIVNVTNEFDYKTIRQNVIDGLSKKEFVLGKFYVILFSAFFATTLLTILGFIAGFAFSPVTDFATIFSHFDFVGAYFLHLVLHLSMVMFLAVLLKRSGILIALLIFYTYIIEPTATQILTHAFHLESLTNFFPLNASWNLLPNPIFKYFLVEVQDYVAWGDVGIALLYISLYLGGTYLLITKKDIN